MATVTSLRWPGLTLPSGHVIPPLGALTTDNENLRMIDNARTIAALVGAGDIAVEYDPDPEPEGLPPPAEPEAAAAAPSKPVKGA